MSAIDLEVHIFHKWFQSLNSAQRRAFLDKLVSLATPEKLFAQVERAMVSSERLPATWEECRNFEEQATFCRRCMERWSATQANAFMNSLEEIDQAVVYEFYDKVARTVSEP